MNLSNKQDIVLKTFLDQGYPQLLLETDDFPVVLNLKGNKDILNHMPTVAVVGTREPSKYGQQIGTRIGSFFSALKFNIVSGLAKGIDSAGHTGALESHGVTTAVLAHGLDQVYPAENRYLADKILANDGLLVSEYFIGQRAMTNFFVERDRLQAGLVQSVVVVETDIKGGTMHTAKFCVDYKRRLISFNHPPEHRNHPKVNGNQKLINEGTATPIFSKDEMYTLAAILLTEFLRKKGEIDTFAFFQHNFNRYFQFLDGETAPSKAPLPIIETVDTGAYWKIFQDVAHKLTLSTWFEDGIFFNFNRHLSNITSSVPPNTNDLLNQFISLVATTFHGRLNHSTDTPPSSIKLTTSDTKPVTTVPMSPSEQRLNQEELSDLSKQANEAPSQHGNDSGEKDAESKKKISKRKNGHPPNATDNKHTKPVKTKKTNRAAKDNFNNQQSLWETE